MPAPPPADAVRAQLERILASPGFANAGRLSRFLRFVVERTLEGEGDSLKEYRLGTEVFDRPSDYDPRLDSIVRVEARRLRAKLAEYYEGPGRGDPIDIRVDKGSYAPEFTTADAIPLPSAPAPVARAAPPRRARWLPVAIAAVALLAVVLVGWQIAGRNTAAASSRIQVAVLPLVRYDASPEPVPEALADAVTDGVTAELARYAAVEVASHASVLPYRTQHPPLADIASALGVEAIVEGRVRVEGPKLWVEIRAVDAKRNRKVFVDDFTGETANRREVERRVAAALVRALTARFAPGVQ
jgi:serine/threonine-protein kinase